MKVNNFISRACSQSYYRYRTLTLAHHLNVNKSYYRYNQDGYCLPKLFSSSTQTDNSVQSKFGLTKVSNLVGRDFLSLKHFERDDLNQFIWTAIDLKMRMKEGDPCQPLLGKTAVLCFDKYDMTARLSAELGIAKLGGSAAFINADQLNLQNKDSLQEVAWLLSSMCDMIITGGQPHSDVHQMADQASVPVINGLSTLLQPLQALAYFMTLQEYFGYLHGMKIAYIGEGNSTLNSLLYGCAKLGIDLEAASPPGYEPDMTVMLESTKLANQSGSSVNIGSQPARCVYRADSIISSPSLRPTGREDLKYQVNRKLLQEAGGTWAFLHSTPRSTREVSDEVFHGKESLVRQAMENRMWITMAVMLHLLQTYEPISNKPKFVRG